MKKYLILIVCLLISQGYSFAQQQTWSLEECIRYAIDHNIQIKQQVIQTMYQKNALDLSKLSLLPTLNGQATHNYSFGRALDESTYEFTQNQNIQSNSFYVGGSMNLFNGLQNYNTIQKNKYEVLASELDLQKIKDNISLNIALAYLQILLNNELVQATNNQLMITKQQIEKTKKMVDAGSLAKGNLLQIEAQAASEELQLINTTNQLDISYLNLTQLLELQSPEGFQIITPEIQIDTNSVITGQINEIFTQAEGLRPEIKSAEMKLAASEFDRKIASGARSPQLSMNHSFSTRYSDIAIRKQNPPPITKNPSEFVHIQVYSCFFNDSVCGHNLEWWGQDNIMWSNDFPHPNSTWPNSLKIIQRDIGHLPLETQTKVLATNVCRLYNLDLANIRGGYCYGRRGCSSIGTAIVNIVAAWANFTPKIQIAESISKYHVITKDTKDSEIITFRIYLLRALRESLRGEMSVSILVVALPR